MSDQENKGRPLDADAGQQTDGSGTPEAELVAQATAAAEEAGKEIVRNFQNLARPQRRRIVLTFRRQLLPPRKSGRKQSKRITAALADWKAGVHGVELYRRHIPGWDKHSQWRRKAESRALLDAIRTRRKRDRRRRQRTEATRDTSC